MMNGVKTIHISLGVDGESMQEVFKMKLLTTDSAELKVSDKKKEIAKIRVRRSENGVKIYFK